MLLQRAWCAIPRRVTPEGLEDHGGRSQPVIVTSTGFPIANLLTVLVGPELRSMDAVGSFSAAWKNSVDASKATLFGTWKFNVYEADGGRTSLAALIMLARSRSPNPST